MSIQSLNQLFQNEFNLAPDADVTQLEYRKYPAWDSVGHMSLCVHLEDAYGITLDGVDFSDLKSYQDCLRILEKHGVTFDEE